MARPTTKAALIEQIRVERRRLEKNLDAIPEADMTQPGVIGQWSVKDVLAHLVAWETMFRNWYAAGLRGEVPEIPAPGLTWGQLDVLNQQIYERYRDHPLDQVLAEFRESYQTTLETVQAMTEGELFAQGYYAWTQGELLAGYVSANTGSHYRWAKTGIRKWLRAKGKG